MDPLSASSAPSGRERTGCALARLAGKIRTLDLTCERVACLNALLDSMAETDKSKRG